MLWLSLAREVLDLQLVAFPLLDHSLLRLEVELVDLGFLGGLVLDLGIADLVHGRGPEALFVELVEGVDKAVEVPFHAQLGFLAGSSLLLRPGVDLRVEYGKEDGSGLIEEAGFELAL